MYSVWAYGSAKITPKLKHDMEISDNIVSVVKKMEVPRLTLGDLAAKAIQTDDCERTRSSLVGRNCPHSKASIRAANDEDSKEHTSGNAGPGPKAYPNHV